MFSPADLALLMATVGASAMAAIGWVVQTTHYPAFLDVPPARFRAFHQRHCRAFGWIVPAPILLEVGGALWLAVDSPSVGLAAWAGLGLALFGVVWTFAVSSPLHGRLASGWDEEAVRRLVSTNLPRTVAWSLHAALGLAMASGLV